MTVEIGTECNLGSSPTSDSLSEQERMKKLLDQDSPLKITLISLHGLIRAKDCELGRDADTGGQVKYVLELAKELALHPNVGQVELLTRQILDPRVSDDYAQLEEPISENAKIVRIPFRSQTVSAKGGLVAVHRDVH